MSETPARLAVGFERRKHVALQQLSRGREHLVTRDRIPHPPQNIYRQL